MHPFSWKEVIKMLKIRLQGTKRAIKMGIRMIVRHRKFVIIRISDLQSEKGKDGLYKVYLDLRAVEHLEAKLHDENVAITDRFFETKTAQVNRECSSNKNDR